MRRSLFLAILVASIFVGPKAEAQMPWASIISFFVNSGDVISNLSKGIDNAYMTGRKINDDFALRELRSQTYALNAKLVRLTTQQRVILTDMEDYLDNIHQNGNSPERWAQALDSMQGVAKDVQTIIEIISQQSTTLVRIAGPDLVYNLLDSLNQRKRFIARIRDLPDPKSEVEINSAYKLVQKYEKLVLAMRHLNVSLKQYVDKFKPN